MMGMQTIPAAQGTRAVTQFPCQSGRNSVKLAPRPRFRGLGDSSESAFAQVEHGADAGIRTPDPRITSAYDGRSLRARWGQVSTTPTRERGMGDTPIPSRTLP